MSMLNLTGLSKNGKIHLYKFEKEFFMFNKIERKIFCTLLIITMLVAEPVFGETGTIDASAVRLRKEPSTESKIITLLEKGKAVEVLKKENGWYNIQTDSYIGWVAENLLAVEDNFEVINVSKTIVDENTNILAVIGNSVNLRQLPTTEAAIVGKVVEGDNLVSYGKSEDGLWYKVKFSDIEGYIYGEYVSTDKNKILGEGTINDGVNFRVGPSTDSDVISQLLPNQKVTITDSNGEWYKVLVGETEGWIVARCVDRVTSTSRSGSSSTAQKVVELAKKQLGKKYVWAANGPNSFDCSGLTKYIFGKVGINLERVSYNQATQGIYVAKANLQPGDLVFFSGINSSSKSAKISHVGIYIGNGKFVHAANSKRGVVTDELSDSYYSTHYVTARRVIR